MPSWVSRNVGLNLNVNYIIIHPATRNLSSQNHELFVATDGGVFRSTNGGRAWAQLVLPDPSNAEFGDAPAATVDELAFYWCAFDPLILNTIYVLAAKDSVSRLWLYRSVDIGETWVSRGVTTT